MPLAAVRGLRRRRSGNLLLGGRGRDFLLGRNGGCFIDEQSLKDGKLIVYCGRGRCNGRRGRLSRSDRGGGRKGVSGCNRRRGGGDLRLDGG
jgi:hypothetical protein